LANYSPRVRSSEALDSEPLSRKFSEQDSVVELPAYTDQAHK
jgi:hypothetical protein